MNRETGTISRRVGFIAAALVLTALVLAWLWSARRGPREVTTNPQSSSGAGMQGMNMKDDGSARLTEGQIQQFGITFGTADNRMLVAETRVAGVVTANETRISQVAPKFGGFVERLYADFSGQAVRRGQPLMEVYSPDVVAAEQELLTARGLQRAIGESAVPGAPPQPVDLVASARRRLELWDVSAAQIDEVLSTGTVPRTVMLYAPASGIVTDKQVVRGQSFQAGQTLYTITDLSEVWIDAALREPEAGTVHVGAGADIELAATSGRVHKGRVSYIYATLDSASRTVRARITAANPDGALKPGMYATVRLYTPSRTALTVPTSAVLRTGERAIVFVDAGHGSLMPHEVTLGTSAGDYTEILGGVEKGARVVTSAQYLLDSESSLGEVMRGMVGQGGTTPMGDGPGTSMPVAADSGADAKGANMRGMKMPPEQR